MTICFQYLLSQYFKKLSIILFTVCLIIYLANTFEVLNKFKDLNVPVTLLIQISLLKLPYLISELSPLICMLSTLWIVNNLIKQNELIIFFNNGIPLLTIIKYIVLINLFFGVSIIMLTPITSGFLAKYDNTLASFKNSKIEVKNLLLKHNKKFIYIDKVDQDMLYSITIIDVLDNSLQNKLFCHYGNITRQNVWVLEDCNIKTDKQETKLDRCILQTDVTKNDIINLSYNTYHLSIWKMMSLINSIKKLGISNISINLHFYKQFFRPLITILFSLLPFYFFNLEKSDIWKNSSMVIIISFIGFLSLNMIVKILALYISSIILCNIIPIAFFLSITLFKIVTSHK